jgi:hypothetical protein
MFCAFGKASFLVFAHYSEVVGGVITGLTTLPFYAESDSFYMLMALPSRARKSW